jgi:flagellar biosynthesis protein FlhF
MQIKRYEARNMTLALRRVKEELGPDAVILSARSLRRGSGIFGKGKQQMVEVTAAVDGRHAGAGPRRSTDQSPETARPHNPVQPHRAAAYRPSKFSAPPKPGGRARSSRSRRESGGRLKFSGFARALHQHLLNQDVDRSTAAHLVEAIQRIPGIEQVTGPDQLRPHLRDLLEEMNIRCQPVGTGTASPRVIAFVGPPGVGKTTTLAKLAARHAGSGRLKQALIGMDGYRIGAIREMQTYADILQLPLAVLNTPAALRATLKRFKTFDVVYLDTAGIGARDRQRMEELQAALAKVKRKEVHLLLRADTRERELTRAIDRFKSLPLSSLGFTHLDACSAHGVLMNILSKADLPLSILCSGQCIPEDLEDGAMDILLNWILKDFSQTEAASQQVPESEEQLQPAAGDPLQYVANRNSDVYHVRQCKWTRKIKDENMVEFATVAEAESQRYLPCRTCKPDAAVPEKRTSLVEDRVTLTSYR